MLDRTLLVLDRLLARVEWSLAVVASVAIFGLMFFAVGEILARRFLGSPIIGYMDIVVLTMVTYGVLAVSYCQRKGGHVRMDLLITSLPGRLRHVLEVLATSIAFTAITLLVPAVYRHAERAYRIGDSTMDIALPTWPAKGLIAVALAVLWLRLLLEIVGQVRLVFRPDAARIAVPDEPSVLDEVEREPAPR